MYKQRHSVAVLIAISARKLQSRPLKSRRRWSQPSMVLMYCQFKGWTHAPCKRDQAITQGFIDKPRWNVLYLFITCMISQFMGLIKKNRINILSVFAIWSLMFNFFLGGGGLRLYKICLPTIPIVLHYRYWHAALIKTNSARLTYIIWQTCEPFGYNDNIEIVTMHTGLKVGPLYLFIDIIRVITAQLDHCDYQVTVVQLNYN